MHYNRQKARAVLDQLIETTKQLAGFGEGSNDFGGDFVVLSSTCEEQFQSLVNIMENLKHPTDKQQIISEDDGEQIANRLRTLLAQTDQCIELLERRKDQVQNQMLSIRRTMKAIRAYQS